MGCKLARPGEIEQPFSVQVLYQPFSFAICSSLFFIRKYSALLEGIRSCIHTTDVIADESVT